MHKSDISTISSQLTSFTGVYCSGFLFNNPALLTAMSLIFDKVYILNQLEHVIDFSTHFKFKNKFEDKDSNVGIIIDHVDSEENSDKYDPFEKLNDSQKATAHQYLKIAFDFSIHYSNLFGEIFYTSLFPNNEVLHAELIQKGTQGEKNLYKVSVNPMNVTLKSDELRNLLKKGAVPIIGDFHTDSWISSAKLPARYYASLLALKSIELVLPQTKAVHPELILEARERLKDFLPQFWASMLRLTNDFKSGLENSISTSELMDACRDYVDIHVRPALVEITQKMILDRKKWFHKIIAPISDGLKLSFGDSTFTNKGLVRAGFIMSNKPMYKFDNDTLLNDINSQHPDLTFLLRLYNFVS